MIVSGSTYGEELPIVVFNEKRTKLCFILHILSGPKSALPYRGALTGDIAQGSEEAAYFPRTSRVVTGKSASRGYGPEGVLTKIRKYRLKKKVS